MFKLLLSMIFSLFILHAGDFNTVNEKLLKASSTGNLQLIKRALKEGANINIQDHLGRSALMLATYNNDYVTSKLLIQKGADVNILDNALNNPFLYAGAEGYIDILRLTIEAGADASLLNRYGGTALIPASEHGYVDVVKLILSKTNTDVNHINNLGWTALLEAIILNDGNKNQQETIKLLIEHGADVNIKDFNNVSPYEHAKKRGFKEIEEILLNANAL